MTIDEVAALLRVDADVVPTPPLAVAGSLLCLEIMGICETRIEREGQVWYSKYKACFDPGGSPDQIKFWPLQLPGTGTLREGVCRMSDVRPSRELIGKPIISMTNGLNIGKVVDVLVDPGTATIAGLVTSKGGLFTHRGEVEAIPADEVEVWGLDAVLVSRPDVIAKVDELPDSQHWLSVADRVKGRDIVSVDGTRIGQLNDVVLNTQGQLVGYDLAQVFVPGPVAESRRIPAEATRSFGKDVLIVGKIQTEETQTQEILAEKRAEESEGPEEILE